MKAEQLKIPGMMLITLKKHGDERGFFMETFRQSALQEIGVNYHFVQDNRSFSRKNILRGMHYQIQKPKGHMISVMRGKIFDVGVDMRKNSPAFGQWCGVTLSAENPQQLFLPPGVAHGFCALEEENEMYYKCTDYYDAQDEGGLLWSDVSIGIEWPLTQPITNTRDSTFPLLSQIPVRRLPQVTI